MKPVPVLVHFSLIMLASPLLWAAGATPALTPAQEAKFQEMEAQIKDLPADKQAQATAGLKELRTQILSLAPAKGKFPLSNSVAEVNTPEGYGFLTPAQTKTLLEDIWGNPASALTLGALVPDGFDPHGDNSHAVIITYEEDGHVDDADAAKTDFNELLKEMKEGTDAGSKERVKQGYESIRLVGWAKAPSYDSASKKMLWAKELEFNGDAAHTLNYDMRVLGRKGVLSLNVVAAMTELKLVETNSAKILQGVNFTMGNRYEDFDDSVDKVAAYGIGALVAGKMATKLGFFAILLKFIKPILIGVGALGVGAFKFFKRDKS